MFMLHDSCSRCASKRYAPVCGVKRRCLLKHKTKLISDVQIPYEECYKPTTKVELFIDFKYNDKLSDSNKKKFEKIIRAHKCWQLNIPEVNVSCCKCGKSYKTKMKDSGWFPKMRKCTHCGAKNYIYY
jgi:hypothetical protein